MSKTTGTLLTLCLTGIVLWWIFVVAPSMSTRPSPEAQKSAAEISSDTWRWEFQSISEANSEMPLTRVTLRFGKTQYDIGVFNGSCVDMKASSWKLADNEAEAAGAICWWAGGGNEIGVFSENGKAVIRVGELEEGDAEHPPFRGNFKTLFEVDFGFIRSIKGENPAIIAFDNALWLSGELGEEAAIQAGLCTRETRAECLPNDYYILNESTTTTQLPADPRVAVYMLTLHAETESIRREAIDFDEYARLINDASLHWSSLPYNITIKSGKIIMIEEIYVP